MQCVFLVPGNADWMYSHLSPDEHLALVTAFWGQAAGRDEHEVGTAERAKPYDIPYGVLVPRRIDGLLFAGRSISASHEALASCRVMCIAMALGAGGGAAAAHAAKHGCELRSVPVSEIQPLLFQRKSSEKL